MFAKKLFIPSSWQVFTFSLFSSKIRNDDSIVLFEWKWENKLKTFLFRHIHVYVVIYRYRCGWTNFFKFVTIGNFYERDEHAIIKSCVDGTEKIHFMSKMSMFFHPLFNYKKLFSRTVAFLYGTRENAHFYSLYSTNDVVNLLLY